MRGKQYIIRVIVCHMAYTECVSGIRTGYNNCTGEPIKKDLSCGPPKLENREGPTKLTDSFSSLTITTSEQQGGESPVVMEHRDSVGVNEVNETTTSFCFEHAVVCQVGRGYIIGFLFTVLMFVTVLYVKRSRQCQRQINMSRVRVISALVTMKDHSMDMNRCERG